MLSDFMARRGHVVSVPVDIQRTVTANWYVEHCLPKVLDAVVVNQPRTHLCALLLHHDNALAHKAHQSKDFLGKNQGFFQVRELSHPPFSRDLALCDLFMFPRVRWQLCGILYDSPEEAAEVLMKVLRDMAASEWASCFTKWFEWMIRCIEVKGEYFEKLILVF